MAVDEEGAADHSPESPATGTRSGFSVRELAPVRTPELSSTAEETSRGQWNVGRMARRPSWGPLVDEILRGAPPQDRAPRLVAEGARREDWTGSVVELALRREELAEDARQERSQEERGRRER